MSWVIVLIKIYEIRMVRLKIKLLTQRYTVEQTMFLPLSSIVDDQPDIKIDGTKLSLLNASLSCCTFVRRMQHVRVPITSVWRWTIYAPTFLLRYHFRWNSPSVLRHDYLCISARKFLRILYAMRRKRISGHPLASVKILEPSKGLYYVLGGGLSP